MGTEESIIYAYDIATAASLIPAFANAKDVVVCDEVSSTPFREPQVYCKDERMT